MQTVIPAEASALARYFMGRVEDTRDALSACHLGRYADEVCIMLPKTAPEFERFVHWAEAMRDTFNRWASLAHVKATHDAGTLDRAAQCLTRLAIDARDVLSLHNARKARNGGT